MRYSYVPESEVAHAASLSLLRVPAARVDDYPAPVLTSLAGVLPDKLPAAVLKLARTVEACGWQTHTQYARGCYPHTTTGRPGPVKESLAVRMARGERGAVAVYVGGSSTWTWGYLYHWSPDVPHTKVKTLTKFLEALA